MDAGVLCLPRFGPEYHNKINSQDDFSLLGTLTKREQEVFTLLRKGLTNSEIASALYISESTVKSHLRSIFRKLGIKKRNEAQILALQGINTTGTKAVTG
ncbi:MAG: response regulator transcription factor [Syntrophomonadaceae bacterium]|nr:response regulator transcription factor [Syntrophomonadaceae bacterium]